MQILDKGSALAVTPLLRLAFRPFFLLGSLLALIAVPLWLLALHGHLDGWQPTGGWLAWHRHELVFGFAVAIIAGFLLTAVQTWTGQPSLSGWPLGVLVAVWLAARISWLTAAPLWLLIPMNLLFLLLLALAMARLLYAVRQTRNYPIVALLLLLLLAEGLALAGLATSNDAWQRQAVLGALWLVAAMMGLIGGRVIPFFTQRGLGRATAVQPWVWLDWTLLLGSAVLALSFSLVWRCSRNCRLACWLRCWLPGTCCACCAGSIATCRVCRCCGRCTWPMPGWCWPVPVWRSGISACCRHCVRSFMR